MENKDKTIYNFDEIVDRVGSGCLKYDFRVERGKTDEFLPLWVADMDFRIAKPIKEALKKQVEHGIYGYDEVKNDYFEVLKNWFSKNFNWTPKKEWLIKTPGIVFAMALAVKAYTNENDAILIQRPVYYPFTNVIVSNNRKLVKSPLKLVNNKYEMDFEDIERKIVEENVKMMLLCSPHNPGGIVWSKEELTKLGNILIKHGVIILSDEIHCDFVYDGYEHTIFSSISDEFEDNSIICTAPSKTFNIAGLQISNIWIKNEKLREKFKKEMDKCGYSQLNSSGLVAAKAAYLDGENWLNQLRAYLKSNLDFMREFINSRLPQINMIEPKGTYLVWLDMRNVYSSKKERDEIIENKAKLWLSEGRIFGSEGEGFERVNIACSKAILKEALERLENAIKNS